MYSASSHSTLCRTILANTGSRKRSKMHVNACLPKFGSNLQSKSINGSNNETLALSFQRFLETGQALVCHRGSQSHYRQVAVKRIIYSIRDCRDILQDTHLTCLHPSCMSSPSSYHRKVLLHIWCQSYCGSIL